MNAYLWVCPWTTAKDGEPALHAIAKWKYTDLGLTWLTTECGELRCRAEDVLLVEDATGHTRLSMPGSAGRAVVPLEKCVECHRRITLTRTL